MVSYFYKTYKEILMNRLMFFIIASLALIIAVIGIVLPVVPTTPLLMVSCYFYSKSSNKFNTWLINTNLYKKYAKDFVDSRTLSLKRKIFLLSFASIMLLYPLLTLNFFLKILIVFIYMYLYYYFIFKIQTK